MRAKPVAVFGVIGFMCDVVQNERRATKLTKEGMAESGYYFFTKGRAVNTVKETGEVFERQAGWFNFEHPGQGASVLTGTPLTIDIDYSEPTEWLCLPLDQNRNGFPDFEAVILQPNQQLTLINGSNLFLARGQLSINNKVFNGPYQIRVRNGDVIATSIDETYSLKVTRNENKGVA